MPRTIAATGIPITTIAIANASTATDASAKPRMTRTNDVLGFRGRVLGVVFIPETIANLGPYDRRDSAPNRRISRVPEGRVQSKSFIS